MYHCASHIHITLNERMYPEIHKKKVFSAIWLTRHDKCVAGADDCIIKHPIYKYFLIVFFFISFTLHDTMHTLHTFKKPFMQWWFSILFTKYDIELELHILCGLKMRP